jgi:hypothetical protein
MFGFWAAMRLDQQRANLVGATYPGCVRVRGEMYRNVEIRPVGYRGTQIAERGGGSAVSAAPELYQNVSW